MSKADEMFEKLGYEKILDDTLMAECIIYCKKIKRKIVVEFREIIFHTSTKTISISLQFLSLEELQAINEKVKELGWLNETKKI